MKLEACDACLRRSFLVALLGPRIEGRLQGPGNRVAGVLALPEPALLAAVAGDDPGAILESLRLIDLGEVRRRAGASAIAMVCIHGDGYPATLHEFRDAPAVLWLRGRTEDAAGTLASDSVTVVGSRAASAYGVEAAYELGRGLGAAGITVVSGLALGIDAASHRGALAAPAGRTVAVLGCGVDVVYPRTNRRLYEQIAERGLVMSELPPGRRPFRWSFPARNRIMAALAEMTVVVEAADPSGSLITSAFAADLGRPVGAVPGRVTDRHAAGTNQLLRDGAFVVRDARDVLDELFGAGGAPDAEPELEPPLGAVLTEVGAGATVDEIALGAGLSGAEARAALGRLELLGLVSRTGLGAYTRAPCIL